MNDPFDIIVIGAGPAGISAALEADHHGATVCLLDEQASAGGQIYRNVSQSTSARTKVLGPDYLEGGKMVRDLEQSGVVHRTGVTVWKVGQDGSVAYSKEETAAQIKGRHIIIANGATERPTPLPGWTKAGAMTVGAAQILMKSAGIVPTDAVLIGSGPLLYLVAQQLVSAGAPPKAVIETQTKKDLLGATRHLVPALKGWKQLAKGLQLIAAIRMAGVPRFTAATNIAIHGEDKVDRVSFDANGKSHSIQTTSALLHQGVVPNTQITRSIGLKHVYNAQQHCFHPVTDAFGQSSNSVFSIAGDGAGIGGAKVAALSGKISALNAVCQIGIIPRGICETRAAPLLKKRSSELAIRPFLDAAYPPPTDVLRPADDTIICRCEEVTAGDIRRFASLGCKGPNQAKSFGRPGMGPCQGRYCGLTVTQILAHETNQSHDAVGAYRIRAPLKPITLKELASLETPKEPETAT
ncbi:NAD(P)/FAD-dependent oxidoreductase [Octadecabacter sp. G9-8]|uniref:NAD(P)/FAD-dependent oxidoreductase n=1 Tax=Octadecabacter dasysiphoniae TaxID=2909341 RepID=A0ABS9D062_9RHOB|nr:NAD(P)/FAD-dependent oxidoreductase [Octadecabacter dasysiphoniae]MCF2871995.1 NAD(P)/FAD-dependent oxidoreductase [Octadecabacter dasysiphoniae]